MGKQMAGGKDLKSIIKQLEYPDEARIMSQVMEQQERVKTRMDRVRHKIPVLSGKGGVGKSMVTVNLAIAFARRGYRVGILDADLNGPCIPKMMGISDLSFEITPEGAIPPSGPLNIKVVSMDFLVTKEENSIRWKGPIDLSPVWLGTMEMSVLREFLSDVVWGEIDFLFIDLPPGAAADKPPVIAGLIPDLNGAVIVTIPTEISLGVVKRSITYARELGITLLGLVENMSGVVCPVCGAEADLLEGETRRIVSDLDIPLLGSIPFDRSLSRSCDRGKPLDEAHFISRRFSGISQRITERLDLKESVFEKI